MIFRNLRRIVSDHYKSLAKETSLVYPVDYLVLAFIFAIVPLGIGSIIAYYVPIWQDLFSVAATVVTILTGFSFNTLILLLRYSDPNGHTFQQKFVNQTRKFTLYSILIGIIITISLVFGYVAFVPAENIGGKFLFAVSTAIYSILVHYFLSLLVITHRLWGLTNSSITD